MKRKLFPPYIHTMWDEYLYKITLGKPSELDPEDKLRMIQSFYCGFANAVDFIKNGIELSPKEDQDQAYQAIREELQHFSNANMDFAKSTGVSTVNTGKPLASTHPHLFKGGAQ